MKKIFTILVSAAATLSVVSCDVTDIFSGKWLDVNSDPNAVSEVGNGLIIPAVELNLINIYGFYGHMMGSYFSEHYAIKPGGPQYLGLSHFDIKDGTLGASFSNFMYRDAYRRVGNNANIIRSQAEASEQWGDYLAATVMKVFALQVMVDAFGETPYSEAFDVNNLAPKYDEGKDVYAGILEELNDALSKVSATDAVSDNMLFDGSSDVNNWIQFANALKLRILMREHAVVDVKSDLAALVASNNFPTQDIGFGKDKWTDQAGQDNPVYSEVVRKRGDIKTGRTIEICAHLAIASTLSEVNDPRLSAKFIPSAGHGNTFEGDFIDEQQSKEITAGYLDEDTYAELNLKYNTPIYLLTMAETEFFLAEYWATIGNDAAKAKAAYEKAIDLSGETHGVEDIDAVYASGSKYAWNASKAMELIGVQKWVHLACVNGFESWCEIRRTGYPAFGQKTGKEIYTRWVEIAKANVDGGEEDPTPKTSQLIEEGLYTPGTLITPVYVEGVPAGTPLARVGYAQFSRTTNSNAPAQKGPTAKVFWAK